MAAPAAPSSPAVQLKQPQMSHTRHDSTDPSQDAARYADVFQPHPSHIKTSRNYSGSSAKSYDRKSEASPDRRQSLCTYDDRRWSKESERESVILGRPLSDTQVRPPPQAFHPVQSPKSIFSSPALSSVPVSPRSPSYDPEKAIALPLSPRTYRSRQDSRSSILEQNCQRCRVRQDSNEVYLEEKALSILLYLSGPVILTSFVCLAWALLSLVLAALLAPVHVLKKGSSTSAQLTSFLSTPLRLQMSLIYSSGNRSTQADNSHHSHRNHGRQGSPQEASAPAPVAEATPQLYRLPFLLMVHLLSPLISIGVALGAWTSAVFWFYAAIIGDPSGRDRPEGYNDGKASVLGVRTWWEHWLTRSLRR